MENLARMKLDILQAFKQSCIDSLLDVANLVRTETDADNRYALEGRRGELLTLLRAIEAELDKRSSLKFRQY
jgi:hypothetical protein